MGVEEYNKKKIEGLRDYKVAFDQEAMWANLQKKKKKRRGAFFLFTMALVALAVVFFALSYSGLLSDNAYSSKTEDAKTQSNDLSTISNADDMKEIKDGGLVDINVELAQDQTLASTTDTQETSGSDAEMDIDNTEGQDASEVSSSAITNRNATESGSQSTWVDNTKSTLDNMSITTSTPATTNQPIFTSPNTGQNIKADREKKEEDVDTGIMIDMLDGFEFPFIKYDRRIDTRLEKLAMNPSPIVQIKPINNPKLLIGMYAGIGAPNRTVSNQDSVLSSLGDETLEEVSLGLELKYRLGSNFFVRGGLEYSHVTDRRTEKTFNVANLNEVEDKESLGIQEGDVGIIVTTTESIEHSIYQSFNVPVLLGWNTNNDKFNLFAEAGAMVNISNRSRGFLPRFEEFNGTEFIVGSRMQVSPVVGIGASYRTRTGYEFFLRSNWKAAQYVTDNTIREERIINQKYSSIRLQAGIRYGF